MSITSVTTIATASIGMPTVSAKASVGEIRSSKNILYLLQNIKLITEPIRKLAALHIALYFIACRLSLL